MEVLTFNTMTLRLMILLFSIPRALSYTKRTANQMVDDVYHGCGFDKYCLKICHPLQPGCDTCIAEHNCPAVVTIEYRNKGYQTHMLIREIGESDEFISIGLSKDKHMGLDPVVICIVLHRPGPESNRTNMLGAWTTGVKTLEFNIEDDSHPYFDLTHEIIDNTYLCTFHWRTKFTMRNNEKGTKFDVEFDLDSEEFHLLGARGEAHGPWTLNGHMKSETQRVVGKHKGLLSVVPQLVDYDETFDERGSSHTISVLLVLACLVWTIGIAYCGWGAW